MSTPFRIPRSSRSARLGAVVGSIAVLVSIGACGAGSEVGASQHQSGL